MLLPFDYIDYTEEIQTKQVRKWQGNKEFVGLTDDEIIECANKSWEGLSPHADTLAFARAIEQELKTKNGFSDVKEKNT